MQDMQQHGLHRFCLQKIYILPIDLGRKVMDSIGQEEIYHEHLQRTCLEGA